MSSKRGRKRAATTAAVHSTVAKTTTVTRQRQQKQQQQTENAQQQIDTKHEKPKTSTNNWNESIEIKDESLENDEQVVTAAAEALTLAIADKPPTSATTTKTTPSSTLSITAATTTTAATTAAKTTATTTATTVSAVPTSTIITPTTTLPIVTPVPTASLMADNSRCDFINLTQQNLLQQQQQLQPLSVTTPLPGLMPSIQLPSGPNQYYIVEDLNGGGLALTPLNSTNAVAVSNGLFGTTNIGSSCGSSTPASAVTPTGGMIGLSATIPTISLHTGPPLNGFGGSYIGCPSTLLGELTDASSVSRFLAEASGKSDYDLQSSDTDEDGYSDIDWDEVDELIEDDNEIDLYDPIWTDIPQGPRKLFHFETSAYDLGLIETPNVREPIHFFNIIVGSDFFQHMADSCNDRAELLLQGYNNVSRSHYKPATSEEMELFYGLCLQMSTMKLPSIVDYWKENSLFNFNGVTKAITHERFEMLLGILNFEKFRDLIDEPNTVGSSGLWAGCGDEQPLADVQPLMDYFNYRMQTNYRCSQRLVINDPLVLWKGRFNWLNDMNQKFRCNAVTLHFLTEQSGLVVKIMSDVERKKKKHLAKNSKLLASQRISMAMELLKCHLNKGHTVTVSKYYGSYGLGYELLQLQTYCTGLLEHRRYGNCRHLMLQNLEKTIFMTKYADRTIMMGKWRRHEKSVYFFSSDCLAINPHEIIATHYRDSRPKIIKELDWQLKGSSQFREIMITYQLGLASSKEVGCNAQVTIYIFNLIIFNAYLFYTKSKPNVKNPSEMKTYKEFRQDIFNHLMRHAENKSTNNNSSNSAILKNCDIENVESQLNSSSNTQDNNSSVTPNEEAFNLLNIEHMPRKMFRKTTNGTKRKKCRVCAKVGIATFTEMCCENCPGSPGLCETPCFKIWHDQLKKALLRKEMSAFKGQSFT